MKTLCFRFWLVPAAVLLVVSSQWVPPARAQGPGDTNPWEDPTLHQCIDNWLNAHMNDPTLCPPNIGPCRGVDEWGNLMTAGYLGATQPDDWHDWYNRWHRIACLWEEPTSGQLRAACQAPPCNWQPGAPPEPAQPGDQPSPATGPATGATATVLDTPPAGFTFYAIYDLLLGTEQANLDFPHMVMSDDGQQILVAGVDRATGQPVLWMMRTDGAASTTIALPDLDGRTVWELAIDYDGSHAFFRATKMPAGDNDWLFVVENGAATRIFETAPYLTGPDPVNVAEQIQTTADGAAVYFHDGDDIWMVRRGGGPPQKVLEDTSVPRDDALAAGPSNVRISSFAISDDAGTIAFIGHSRVDPSVGVGFAAKPEVFVVSGGSFRQITNDAETVNKELVAISGDGSTVVYGQGAAEWRASRHGGPPVFLENAGFNFGGMDLTFDGSLWAYYDTGAHGGRIARTDGTGGLDVFPTVNWIQIEATNDVSISDDGTIISFRNHAGFYVGFLNDPRAVPAAPTIQSISFSAPEAESEYAAILQAPITGAGALVPWVDQLLDGRRVNEEHAPLGFGRPPNDEGAYPDAAAGDGVFSCGGRHHSSGTQTVRVAVMDVEQSVTVADVLVSEP